MVILLILFLSILAFGLLFISTSFLISNIYGAPAVSSKRQVIIKSLEMAGIKPNQKIIDLGCGSGKVLDIARKQFKARVYGCEVSPLSYLISKFKHNNIFYINIFNLDFDKYDFIYIYLYPNLVGKLESKLLKAIKNKTTVIAISFGLKKIQPVKMQKYLGRTIYIYK